MSQYKTGTASVTNNSPTVTGTNTLWLANVSAGDSFTIASSGVVYDVASVDSDTQITLSVAYAGATASGAVYAIGTSFTVPDNFPEMSQGDIETATIFTRAMRKIQGKFNTSLDQAALSNAAIYQSAEEGLVNTVSGELFFATDGSDYVLYSNDSGSAVEEARFANFTSVEALSEAAANSALASSNSADNSAGSATASQNAETGSIAARDATEALLDQFGDQYLGSKSSDPTTDNDGDPLNSGDIYWNSTDNVLKFYTGTAWVAPEDIASTAASNAQASEDAAATSESNASTSEVNAGNSADAASVSEGNAATSETNAGNSANAASTSASNASTSATNASNSAGAAALSESNAADSEQAAATSESNAATAASDAVSDHVAEADPHTQYADKATTYTETEVDGLLDGYVTEAPSDGNAYVRKNGAWMRLFIDELKQLIFTLFSAGEQGAFYIPKPIINDDQVLFQDSAGTVPVTADGDPVGRMLDQSGRGNHATQSVSGSRPVYRTDGVLHWLQPDGIDDNLAHPYSSGTSNLTLAASGATTKDSGRQQLIGAGGPSSKLTSLIWVKVRYSHSWGTFSSHDAVSGDSAFNTPIVMINVGNYTSEVQNLYTNGQLAATFTGMYAGDPDDRRVIGAENVDSDFMEGRIYGIVALGRETTSSELSDLNKYLADLAGITL